MVAGVGGYTTLEYRGVQLRNCQIIKFREAPEYDSSGLELVRLNGQIRVIGYFTADKTWPREKDGDDVGDHLSASMDKGQFGTFPQWVSQSASEPEQVASEMMHALHSFLNMPQGHLKVIFNDSPQATDNHVLIDIMQAPTDYVDDQANQAEMSTIVDAKGGPKPQEINITNVAGNNTWRIEYEVHWSRIARCYVDTSEDPVEELDADTNLFDQFGSEELKETDLDHSKHKRFGVLSNRWSAIDTVNENRYLNRIIRGEVELSNPGWNPHDYRLLTMPPLHPGMRRKSMDFTASADGLRLQYSIVDEEVTLSPPGNTTNFSMNHEEQSSLLVPNVVLFNIRCEVMGDRTTSRGEMIATAASLIDGKILLTALLDPAQDVFKIMVNRTELAAHDASDQRNTIALAMGGKRVIENWRADAPMNNAPDPLKWMSASVGARPTALAVDGSVLEYYNNQRAKGNRDVRNAEGVVIGFETPVPEGPISGLSALAAALQERCTDNFAVGRAAAFQLDSTSSLKRAARAVELDGVQTAGNATDYDPSQIFDASTLVQIVDTVPTASDTQFSLSHKSNIYQSYQISSSYVEDELTYQLPVADTTQTLVGSPTIPTSVIVGVGSTITRRMVRVEAARYGAAPRLPSPVTVVSEASSTGAVDFTAMALERKEIQLLDPVAAIDGLGLIYRVALILHYNYTRPPDLIRAGIPDPHAAAGETDPVGGTPNSILDLYRFTRGTLFSADWAISE